MAEPRKVYTADIKGQSVKFYAPTETQLAFMGRAAVRADRSQRKEDYKGTITAVADLLDIVDSLFLEESDREKLSEMMRIGALEVDELMSAIEYARIDDAIAPTNGPVAKPRVRRGTPK